MKTYKSTSTLNVMAPNFLSFEEIQKEEGIYSIESYDEQFFIVLKSKFSHKSTVLYYHTDGVLQLSANWENSKFRKTNKKLYMEIK